MLLKLLFEFDHAQEFGITIPSKRKQNDIHNLKKYVKNKIITFLITSLQIM